MYCVTAHSVPVSSRSLSLHEAEFPIKRPSSKDTEEDVLKFQEEFLKEKSKPAASVENKSDGSRGRMSDKSCSSSKENTTGEDTVEVSSKVVLHDIKERNIVGPTVILPQRKAEPFPIVSKRSTQEKSVKGKKSIFAQQMEKKRAEYLQKQSSSSTPVEFFNCPVIIDGTGLRKSIAETEAKRIHEENVARLSKLTEEEILSERQLLLEKMNPKLIDFIRKKKESKLVKDHQKYEKSTDQACQLPSSISVSTREPQGIIDIQYKMEGDADIRGKDALKIANEKGDEASSSHWDDSCYDFRKEEDSSDNFVEEDELLPKKLYQKKKDEPCNPDGAAKMCEGYDRDGIILESMQQEIISDAQTDMSATYPSNKNVELNTAKGIKLPVEELPINPISAAKKWPHMDKVEDSKLMWMGMIPELDPKDLEAQRTGRFDFEGKITSPVDFAIQKGLHHHSEEQEFPGYTIEELFLLSRSSVQNQRVIALRTLALILENNWQGMFDGCFEELLLTRVLNSGIVPLLRWALDDTTDSSIAAAVMAIHHLLVCSTDEFCLDMTFPWANGHMSPFIKPYDAEEVPEGSLKDLTDANIIKLDVIKGFLRVDILPRLRYILAVTCPPFPVCQLIIEVLIRIARHSYKSAKQIVECPFLMETIFKKFLPTTWNFNSNEDDETKNTSDFVCPVPCALKLVRVISSSSIQLASDLITNHNLDSSLCYYLSLGLSDGKLSAVSFQKLLIETFRTWQVLLANGFCSDIYVDLFPVLLRQLQYFLTISISAGSGVHVSDYMYASAFFKALEAVVTVATDHEKLSSRSNFSIHKSSVMWTHVTGLLPMVENCLQKWLHEFSRGETTTASSVLLASCVDFYNAYCTKAKEQLNVESPENKSNMQKVIAGYILPCLQSVNFASYLDNLRSYSVLLYDGFPGSKRSTNTLTSLGSILWEDDIVPILKEGTPFPLTASITGLLVTLIRLLPDFDEKAAKIILLHPLVVKYVREVAARSAHFNHWFDRFEIAFIFNLIQLSSLKVCGDPTMWHMLSLSLLPNIRTSDEWIVKYLMENIIFNDDLLLYNVDRSQALIHGEEQTEENYVSKEKLLKIGQVYVDFFLSASSINKSRQKWLKATYNWPISIDDDMQSLVPQDWPYKPLLILYQHSKNNEILSPELTEEVTAFLEWIYLSQKLQLPAFKHISSSVVFCHLCLVFLLGSDLFYNLRIKDILQSCLCLLVKQKLDGLEKLQWNNTSKFDELLSDLVVQFEAESYGDQVFANYLLVAFQQCYPSRWKKFVFDEHLQAVQIIRIPLSKLIVPLTNFLEPKETDNDLLTLYVNGLSSNLLNPKRSPLLYLMAVHHLHHYIFMTYEQSSTFQKTLLNSLMQCRKREVIYNVLLYKNPNENEHLGFEKSECLTSEAELHLSNLYGKPVLL